MGKNGLVHVFDEYYLDSDSLNIIICKERIIKSGKNKDNAVYDNVGFYTSAKALLTGLISRYSIRYMNDIAKTGEFINIENFVKAVEEIEIKFEKERTRGNKQ